MRYTTVCLWIFLCVFSATEIWGQSINPVYRKLGISANYPASSGLTINFDIDEDLCRKKYGSQWRIKCSAALGRAGDTAKGVVMSPSATGYWQWANGNTLTFIPDNPAALKPDTVYKIGVHNLYLPSFIVLDRKEASLRTPIFACRLMDSRFWVNPAPDGNHQFAASLEFNYPVAEKDIIEATASTGARLGKPRAVWSDDAQRVNLVVPVISLPQVETQARLLVKAAGQMWLQDGVPTFRKLADMSGKVSFSQNLPAANSIFTIRKASVHREENSRMDRIFVLEMETSLYSRQEEMLKNLTVWELPKYNSPEAIQPCDWRAAPSVSKDILKKSRKLQAVPLDNSKIPQAVFRFEVPATPDSYLLVSMSDDLKSAGDMGMLKPWFGILRVPGDSAILEFMQPGNILPMHGKGKLDFRAGGIDAIKWEIQKVEKPFLALLAQSSGNVFQNPLSGFGFGMESISQGKRGQLDIGPAEEGKSRFISLPLGEELRNFQPGFDSGSCVARINMTGLQNNQEKAWASRLILFTDLGIFVKSSASGAMDCFVYSLSSGKPVAHANVSILGANGKAVLTGETDSAGHVAFSSTSGFRQESLPVAAMAQYDGSLAWLPLQDKTRELNYSGFDTKGKIIQPDGVQTYIFSQRGIYRPGDQVYFACVTRRGDLSLLPESLPLFAELRNPAGKKIWQTAFKSGKLGMSELIWTAPSDCLSGRYNLIVKNGKDGDVLGTLAVRMEEFQPDSLKLKVDNPVFKGWFPVSRDGLDTMEIKATLNTLYGEPARNHKIRATLQTIPATFSFAGYEDYIFTDAAPFSGQGHTKKLPETHTDDNGFAIIKVPVSAFGDASSRVLVGVEGFEAGGGRATIGSSSFLASPMRQVLGYKPLGALTNMQFIKQNDDARLQFVALSSSLEPAACPGLDFAVSRRKYITSLISDASGGLRYDQTPVEIPLQQWQEDLPVNGLVCNLNTSEPGEYLLVVRDNSGQILARVPYAVTGNAPIKADKELAASAMRLRLDRKRYSAGDNMQLSLSLPYAGSGLISIERDGVKAFKWFDAEAGDSVQALPVPEDFEGKGYVAVTFLRASDSTAIYMEPIACAIEPFEVNVARRDMGLKLDAPTHAAPGESVSVRVSARMPGRAILFAVDEGILNLTGYVAPSPLKGLLLDRTLDVRTLQAADLLMPTHEQLAPRLSAFGGGMDGGAFGLRFQNPFKRRNEPPVTTWSGIVPVGADDRDFEIPVPQWYSGKLRIMAVGVAESGTGSAKAETVIAAPLVISPQLPFNLSPGDTFNGVCVLANTTAEPMPVELVIDSGKGLELKNDMPASINLAPHAEMAIPFAMKAGPGLGVSNISFKANVSGQEYRRDVSISVRPPSPLRTTILGGSARESISIDVPRKVYALDASSVASVSGWPLPLANSFAQYLQNYPFGCSEQLVSRGFSHILLRNWPQLAYGKESDRQLLSDITGALRARFNGQGVSIWPNGEPSLLMTVYAADFLLSLREAGINGNDDLLEQLCDAIANGCALNESSLEAARISAYAVWVLTREGRITTQYLENLLNALSERQISGWQTDLTCLFIASSQRHMQIMNHVRFDRIIYNPDGWFDEFGQYAFHMALLGRYFPQLCSEEMKAGFYEAASFVMGNNTFATFSACQGMRALFVLSQTARPTVMDARLHCENNTEAGKGTVIGDGEIYKYDIAECDRYRLDVTSGPLPVFWQIAVTGYDMELPDNGVEHGIEVERHYLDDQGQPIKTINIGDVVTVRLSARALKSEIRDCAIIDLLPGGFEMVLPRDSWKEELPEGVKIINRLEDRMLVFADLANTPLIFEYKARAVTSGDFGAAPLTAQAMYNQTQYGSSPAGRVSISN